MLKVTELQLQLLVAGAAMQKPGLAKDLVFCGYGFMRNEYLYRYYQPGFCFMAGIFLISSSGMGSRYISGRKLCLRTDSVTV